MNEQSNEIERGALAAALIGQTIVSAELEGSGPDDGYIVLETTGGVRLYADAPTAYRVDPPRPHPGIALIEARYAEADERYSQLEAGVNDDSVLEAERDTLAWVLTTLRGTFNPAKCVSPVPHVPCPNCAGKERDEAIARGRQLSQPPPEYFRHDHS